MGNIGTIVSPDKDVEIEYSVSRVEVFGQTCGDQVTVKSLDRASIGGFSKGAERISAITQSEDGRYAYHVVAVPKSAADELVVDGTVCDASFNGHNIVAENPLVIVRVNAKFNNLGTDATYDDIKSTLASSNADIATRIISSLAD